MTPDADHGAGLADDAPRMAPSDHSVQSVLPWAVSLVVHLGLVIIGFAITWTVVRLAEDRAPILIVADFDAPAYEPLTAFNAESVDDEQPVTQDTLDPIEIDVSIDPAFELPTDPLQDLADTASVRPPADFSPRAAPAQARFMGVEASNARNIVYVIDASGSMITWMPTVIEGLIRSIDALNEQQNFAVLFAQGDGVLIVPPENRLIYAIAREKHRVYRWIDNNVIPAGSTEPLAAIERALRFKPDAIFLLSTSITGAGVYEIDQAELLAELKRLNPIDRKSGRRPVQINGVQFIETDPANTLEIIAQQHGGTHSFISRRDLGFDSP